MLGDWNARLIYPITEIEEDIMGKHTMHKDGNQSDTSTESMRENRNLMVGFCMTNELKTVSTMYRKTQKNSDIHQNRNGARRTNTCRHT